MKRNLAESDKYKIISEYETVSLYFKTNNRNPIVIGDFYGDPECAIISKDETYVAMAGCGLIVYKLQKPFEEYKGDEKNTQYFVFNNIEPDIWWTNGLNQSLDDVDPKYFRFVKEENSNEVIYRFDTSTNKVDKPL